MNLIKYMELSSQLEVVGIITDLSETTIKLDGYLCISKRDISIMEYGYILIMSDKAYGEIVREALDLGIASECFLSYKVLDKLES